jgi:hypothetical protein
MSCKSFKLLTNLTTAITPAIAKVDRTQRIQPSDRAIGETIVSVIALSELETFDAVMAKVSDVEPIARYSVVSSSKNCSN